MYAIRSYYVLRAVDAVDGKPCDDFGKGGAVDLRAGMSGQLPESRFKVEAIPSSPAAIVNGVVVVGQTVSDLASLDAPSGVVRGFDAVTGKLLWAWNSGMEQASAEVKSGDAYARATPNAWGPLSGDDRITSYNVCYTKLLRASTTRSNRQSPGNSNNARRPRCRP